MKKVIINLVFIFFLSLGTMYGFFRYNKDDMPLVFERRYSTGLLPLPALPVSDAGESIRVNGAHIFTCDIRRNRVRQYSMDGIVEKTLGQANDAIPDSNLIISFFVDPSAVYLGYPRRRKFTVIDVGSTKITTWPTPKFERALALDNNSFLFSSLNPTKQDISFIKWNATDQKADTLNMNLPSVADGGFANDGFYKRSSDGRSALFVLYHLGKFVRLDSAGSVSFVHNTVDNYSRVPVVSRVGGQFTLSRKTKRVNKTAAINSRYIFVLSELRSITDTSAGTPGKIIDIYQASTGAYLGSYPLSGMKGESIVDMDADETSLFVLTSKNIYPYKIINGL
jgi:hypothetical protein